MDKIQLWVDHLLETFGLEGDCVAYISHAVLALIAILLAVVAGLLCRRILVPIVLRLTKKTGAKWAGYCCLGRSTIFQQFMKCWLVSLPFTLP